jgi:hypothetical protein
MSEARAAIQRRPAPPGRVTLSLAAHGIALTLPDRWEGRLYLREDDELANPILHAANFALPAARGDFGSGAVDLMGEQHVFVSLFEYGSEEAGRPLFAARGFPRLTVDDFAPNQLQRRLPGQLGCQRFFTDRGRAFCLYVVLGSQRHAASLIPEVHELLARVRVEQRWQTL